MKVRIRANWKSVLLDAAMFLVILGACWFAFGDVFEVMR